MSKPLMVGLVLASMLTGCKTPVAIQAAPLQKEGIVTGAMAKKMLPAGTPTVGPKAKASNPVSAMTPRGTGQTSALTGAGGVEGGAGATAPSAGLALLDTQAPSLKLVPIYGENDELTSMLAQPSTGALSWKLQGVKGTVSVGSVRLVIRREAVRTPLTVLPGQPDPAASPLPPVGDPMSFDLTAQAVGLPDATRAGVGYTLKLNLMGDEARAFVTANPTTSQASVVVTLLDASGDPVPDADGAPLTLTARVTVL